AARHDLLRATGAGPADAERGPGTDRAVPTVHARGQRLQRRVLETEGPGLPHGVGARPGGVPEAVPPGTAGTVSQLPGDRWSGTASDPGSVSRAIRLSPTPTRGLRGADLAVGVPGPGGAAGPARPRHPLQALRARGAVVAAESTRNDG